MSVRFDFSTKMKLQGKNYTLLVVQNPTVDEVLSIEARLYAADVEAGKSLDPGHRVDRGIRDFLIKAGS
jgi:hypothetical protein